MPRKITIYRGEEDISNDVSLEKHKANPFGWSQAEVHYQGKRIGWMENGAFMDFEHGYSFKEELISQDEYNKLPY